PPAERNTIERDEGIDRRRIHVQLAFERLCGEREGGRLSGSNEYGRWLRPEVTRPAQEHSVAARLEGPCPGRLPNNDVVDDDVQRFSVPLRDRQLAKVREGDQMSIDRRVLPTCNVDPSFEGGEAFLIDTHEVGARRHAQGRSYR